MPGSTSSVRVTKPALGPKRYEIAAERLSVQGAKDLATALYLRLEQLAERNDRTATEETPR